MQPKHLFELQLRPYTDDDAPACLEVWRRASRSGHPFLSDVDLDSDAALVRDVYLPSARVTVAERDGAIVGFAALYDGMVGALFVDPPHQGLGIGTRLLGALGQGKLSLEVYAENRRARGFYASRGFLETLCHLVDDRGRPHPLVRMTRPARATTGPAPQASGLRAAA